MPWRWAWLPTPIFLPGEFHRHRSSVGYSPRGLRELDTTEQPSTQRCTRKRISWVIRNRQCFQIPLRSLWRSALKYAPWAWQVMSPEEWACMSSRSLAFVHGLEMVCLGFVQQRPLDPIEACRCPCLQPRSKDPGTFEVERNIQTLWKLCRRFWCPSKIHSQRSQSLGSPDRAGQWRWSVQVVGRFLSMVGHHCGVRLAGRMGPNNS